MRFAYVGNFKAPYSTENDVARALRNNGHHATQIPEQSLDWSALPDLVAGHDVFLWTRTAGYDPPDLTVQDWALHKLRDRGVPSVGYHLDRWWGLDRESSIVQSPFFTVDLLCTAHGAEEWGEHGYRHRWFPPAVSRQWTEPGTYRKQWESRVAFVGNLEGYGHQEWQPYRRRIAETFQDYPGWKVFPGPGKRAIRGKSLADIYASGRVFIGDSCLAGDPVRYWSDRVPETLGRGGFLIHPDVVGLEGQYPELVTYTLGDFDDLREMVDYWLAHDELRRGVAEENKRWVLSHHTYEHRMEWLVEVLEEEGLI